MSIHWPAIFEMLTRVAGVDLLTAKATPVRGGCIHQAFCVENQGNKFFLKLNTHDKGPMFAAEFDALQQLEKTQALQVPEPIAHGVDDGFAWLVTEFLDLVPASVLAHEALGRQLAMLHNEPRPHFAWHRDNAIGLTLQINDVNPEWMPFFREKRIGWQLELARRDGYVFDGSERLMESMEVLFAGYEPSLLPCSTEIFGMEISPCSQTTVRWFLIPRPILETQRPNLASWRCLVGSRSVSKMPTERFAPRNQALSSADIFTGSTTS